MISQAMIFAAGRGSRMGALTHNTPKPLLPLGRRTLLDHALDLLREIGIKHIVINTHYHGAQIATHLQSARDITLIHESPKALETGGGLKNALHLFDCGPILTMNADLYFAPPNPLHQLLDNWAPQQMDSLLLLLPRAQAIAHKGDGDFDLPAPIAPIAFKSTNSASHIFTGVQIINPARLCDIDQDIFSIKALWQLHAAQSRMWGVQTDATWVDVGHPAGLRAANAILDNTCA